MTTLRANEVLTDVLRHGQVLTVTGDALVERIGIDKTAVPSSQAFGPYDVDVQYRVTCFTDTVDCAVTADVVTINADAGTTLRTKYLLALVDRVHMEVDLEGLTGLIALPVDALQAAANARAEALRAAANAHYLGVGTLYVDGEHKAADTTNSTTLLAVATATSLPTCIDLINGLQTTSVAHGNQAGVHFHDDAGEVASTISVDPPVTLDDCIADLNELRQNFLDHFAKGSQ